MCCFPSSVYVFIDSREAIVLFSIQCVCIYRLQRSHCAVFHPVCMFYRLQRSHCAVFHPVCMYLLTPDNCSLSSFSHLEYAARLGRTSRQGNPKLTCRNRTTIHVQWYWIWTDRKQYKRGKNQHIKNLIVPQTTKKEWTWVSSWDHGQTQVFLSKDY